jgi:hypothetical protein
MREEHSAFSAAGAGAAFQIRCLVELNRVVRVWWRSTPSQYNRGHCAGVLERSVAHVPGVN